MRRAFRADLIVDIPPKKIMKHQKRQYVSRKNIAFQNLMRLWIDQAGDRFCNKALAKRAVVQTKTVNKWILGYQPGKYSLWPIASYFGEILKKPRKELYKEIIDCCIEF